jgi:hypothetical protein
MIIDALRSKIETLFLHFDFATCILNSTSYIAIQRKNQQNYCSMQ